MQPGTMYGSLDKLPTRLQVETLVESRYANGERPRSWDQRKEGTDIVRTAEGQTVRLWSDGGQTPPQPGWVIMVTDGSADAGYRWTLYGIPQRA